MSETKSLNLDTDHVGHLLLRFALPSIASFLITSLYNIADQVFIGHSSWGYLGNAATSIVFPITMIGFALALWCGDGAAAYSSLQQGKKCPQHIHRGVAAALATSLLGSLLLVAVTFTLQDPLLRLFGASETSLPLAREYFRIIIGFAPVFMVMSTLGPIIRADGAPNRAMAVIMTGALLNIVLDPLFIFYFHWGVAGAAWATVIGQTVSLLLALSYLPQAKNFHLRPDSFRLDRPTLTTVLRLGASSLIAQLSIVVTALVCNYSLSKFGALSKFGSDIPVAVVGIVMKVFSIVLSVTIGVMLGAQPLLGYNYGAGKYQRVKRLYKIVAAISLGGSLAITAVFQLWPDVIINLFGSESELYMEFARSTFRIFLLLVSVTCLIKITAIFFQSLGQSRPATLLSLSRDLVSFVPLVLILPHFCGVTGVLWAAPLADIIGLIVMVILLTSFWRTLATDRPPTTACESPLSR
ncbi:MATE family efflux transporter [bacterium]|nr:MATE family efflux transporter [bacterium]